MIDRFSNLPEEVAYHILSFLTMPDLACFGCVSTTCSKLCLSAPSLDFDDFSIENTYTCDKRKRLFDSLDSFLIRRRGIKIQCFSVCWISHFVDDSDKTQCFCDDEYSRMISWIENAVNCDVEELYIQMTTASEVDPLFPSSVFVCRSLRSLVVNIFCKLHEVPSFDFSSNLKYLELRHVVIDDEEFFKWMSCCCKCIEGLVIQQVRGIKNITIESSSLESFTFVDEHWIDMLNISGDRLEDLIIEWIFHSPNKKLLNIFAPNLKSLKWAGNLMNHLSLGKLECLEKAGIFLEPKVDGFGKLFEVLRSLSRVKVLGLNEATIKICGFNMGYWKLQNLIFTQQLKEVTIALSINGSIGVEFARYILEYAPILDKMVIVYKPQQSDVVEMFVKSKPISNAMVVLLLVKKEVE